MKKLIKDLTLLEANKYCRQHSCFKGCPFHHKDEGCLLAVLTEKLSKRYQEVMEREVDIDE